MTLSADKLNLRAPYQLTQINDMTFSFVTDKQIHYNVGFYKDTYFMDEGAYHFFIDRSTSGRLQGKNSEHEHGSYYPKILDTVTVILEDFFSASIDQNGRALCSFIITGRLPAFIIPYHKCG